MFRLAERLGMTVADVSRRVSSAEFTEWVALNMVDAEDRQQRELKARAQHSVRKMKARKLR